MRLEEEIEAIREGRLKQKGVETTEQELLCDILVILGEIRAHIKQSNKMLEWLTMAIAIGVGVLIMSHFANPK